MAARLVPVPPSAFSLNLAVALAHVGDDGVMFITSPNEMNLNHIENAELTKAANIIA